MDFEPLPRKNLTIGGRRQVFDAHETAKQVKEASFSCIPQHWRSFIEMARCSLQIDDNELSLPFSSALETKSTKQGPYRVNTALKDSLKNRVIFLTLSRVTTIRKGESGPSAPAFALHPLFPSSHRLLQVSGTFDLRQNRSVISFGPCLLRSFRVNRSLTSTDLCFWFILLPVFDSDLVLYSSCFVFRFGCLFLGRLIE
ncbi:hypothetical protein HPP92_005728 [Vanilla planifolia]|uniref:Uncharacterized protein n=1 Tax=Vanilla planifolia TaxID=51239 RepID=A0A835RN89_VANPL|nr:hypothetical protein HPP92_005728 [Vanilla planifolia]